MQTRPSAHSEHIIIDSDPDHTDFEPFSVLVPNYGSKLSVGLWSQLQESVLGVAERRASAGNTEAIKITDMDGLAEKVVTGIIKSEIESREAA